MRTYKIRFGFCIECQRVLTDRLVSARRKKNYVYATRTEITATVQNKAGMPDCT